MFVECNYSSCTVHVGAVKICVAAVQALRKKETQDETQFTSQNWWKKLVWVPVTRLMPYYPETGRSRYLIA